MRAACGLGCQAVESWSVARHMVGMEPKDSNLAELEKALNGLKPDQKLLSIKSSDLRHIFGAEIEDAVKAADELAKRYHCEFRYCPEQGLSHFQRKIMTK